jgi:hypothetical protein
MNILDKRNMTAPRPGQDYLVSLVFPAGSDLTTVRIQLKERIENIRKISIQEASITLAPNGDNTFPAKLDLCASPCVFYSNIQYGSPLDSVPIVLHNPVETPLGNYRFSMLYPFDFHVNRTPSSVSKQFPDNVIFTLSGPPGFNLGTASDQPGSQLPVNRATFAEQSCIVLKISTWDKLLENPRNPLFNIPKSFY